jgi:CheY-like chemotaxis protein
MDGRPASFAALLLAAQLYVRAAWTWQLGWAAWAALGACAAGAGGCLGAHLIGAAGSVGSASAARAALQGALPGARGRAAAEALLAPGAGPALALLVLDLALIACAPGAGLSGSELSLFKLSVLATRGAWAAEAPEGPRRLLLTASLLVAALAAALLIPNASSMLEMAAFTVLALSASAALAGMDEQAQAAAPSPSAAPAPAPALAPAQEMEMEQQAAGRTAGGDNLDPLMSLMSFGSQNWAGYLATVEHRLNNPVQRLLFTLEELSALMGVLMHAAEQHQQHQQLLQKIADGLPAPADTVADSARRVLRREEVEASDAAHLSRKLDQRGSSLIQESVIEAVSLVDQALCAMDNVTMSISDLRFLMSSDQSSLRRANFVPTNLLWTMERCELSIKSTKVDHVEMSSRPATQVAPGVLEGPKVSFVIAPEIKTCIMEPETLLAITSRLVFNSRRFTDSGSIEVCVDVVPAPAKRPLSPRPEARLVDKFLRISVKDTGSGVPPQFVPLLFLAPRSSRLPAASKQTPTQQQHLQQQPQRLPPFPKADDYKGFGLFVVAKMCSLMGARISHRPNDEAPGGNGSVFIVEVAYEPTELEPSSRAPPRVLRSLVQRRHRLDASAQLPSLGEPGDGRKASTLAKDRDMGSRVLDSRDPAAKRVLIIEDEAVQRTLMCRHLQGLGYEVFQAEDGEQGLRMMKERQYRLVICDKVMPVMNGDECVQHFREWEKGALETGSLRKVPQYICGLSANREYQTSEGFNMYMAKPIHRKELAELLSFKKV